MLKSGNLVDVFERQIYPANIIVEDGIIKNIERTEENFDSYILPGLIDSHVHIESSMLVPSEFARASVRFGTVGVVSDPHEIANVLGVAGVDFMIENAAKVPMKFFFGAPSCVPATDLESSGAELNSNIVGDLMDRDDIYFLSEMMNYPGVVSGSEEVLKKIDRAQKAGKPVDGHAPGIVGDSLQSYVAAGISTDHEASTIEEAREKIALGMKILIREGSAARNLEALAPLFKEVPSMLMLCSDDIHPEMLNTRHLDGPVRFLLDKGYDIFDVLRSVSLNVVDHYKLPVGLLRIGDSADFIVIDDFDKFEVKETWIEGEKVYGDKTVNFDSVPILARNQFNSSRISVDDIRVSNKESGVRVIEIEDGELFTKTGIYRWSEKDILESDTEGDILKIVLKERYNDRPSSVAFIKGFGLQEGAMASSVAHDSHNIIAVGVDDHSIVGALNAVVDSKGGLSVCKKGSIDLLPLPVAGIMSDVPCGTIADEYMKLSNKVKDMGSYLKAPFMTLSFMALLVIPELKLGDRGLFDAVKFKFTSLFAD